MTVHVTADIHFSESDVSHKWHPADDKCHAYGVLKFAFGANLYFQHAGHLDAVIAELVALKQEMAPPVITDSERTCPETHPDSGLPCHRDGDHGVHRDPDGEEWRTDGKPAAIEPRSGCKCGHTGTVHFLDLLAGGDLTYCHACDCEQYEYVQPASVTR